MQEALEPARGEPISSKVSRSASESISSLWSSVLGLRVEVQRHASGLLGVPGILGPGRPCARATMIGT